MKLTRMLSLAILAAVVAAPALAQRAPISDAQVRDAIIRDSIAHYKATGHPCACPYDLMRNGHQCGNVSAYVRPGGASPLCYPKDVSDAMVAEWKRAHP